MTPELNRRVFLGGLGGLALGPAPSRIIDTHTHFYDPTRPQGVPWPPKNDPVLYQPTLPERYRKLTQALGVTGAIVVEASPWLEDNQWVLDLAKDNPIIVGVVGNLRPGTPEFKDHLARFSKNRLFLGIRVNGALLAKGMAQPPFIEDLERLAGANLELDVLGGSAMFSDLVRLTDRLSNLRIVINHLPFDPPADAKALRELGSRPSVYAKVSGVLRRIDGKVPTELSLYRQALDELWEVFGADRLLYGSNWPVSDKLAPYAAVLQVVMEYFRGKGQSTLEKYFWKNAVAAYRPALALAQPADTLKPFTMNHRAQAASAVDVSFLLDPPAGKRGFVRVRGGHLATPDGRRLRLWGVNVTDWSKGSLMIPPKQDAPLWAATLAKFGVNSVRLHFLDLAAPRGLIDSTRDDTRSFDAQQLDRLDFWIAELKKKGVYIDLNLNVGRSYKAGDGVRDASQIRWAKGLTLFDARLIELQKEYAKQLLTHYNPYTKSEYRSEPAVAIVELVNENALYAGFRVPTPAYEQELTELYNQTLRKMLSPEQLARLRATAGLTGDDPLPRLARAEFAKVPKERFSTEMAVFIEMENTYFREMLRYLKETLGVRSLVIATADHAHSGSSYPLLYSTSLADIVDGHTYWQHPGPKGIPNTPMVNQPLQSTVVELSRTAFASKPYTVSEVNHPFPNEYGSEGIPILVAYGSLQDWDGIFWYTFEPKRAADWPSYVGDPFDISLDPVKMPQLAAGALMFVRNDVARARKVVERSYSRQQVYQSVLLPGAERPYFTPGFPLSIPLRQRSRIRSLDGGPAAAITADETNPIISDTHELAWTVSTEKAGLVSVETSRTQALVGFVRAHRKVLRNLSAEVRNDFCAIVLASLDSRPLSRSGRMLLATGARVANTGAEWNATRTALTNWGGPPSLIEPVAGKVVLRNLAGATAVSAAALDGAGRPLGYPILAKRTPEGFELAIGDPATTWYVITVKRR